MQVPAAAAAAAAAAPASSAGFVTQAGPVLARTATTALRLISR